MRYFLIIISVLLPVISEAQLSAPGMNAVRYTSYPAKDPIFIFCNASGSQKGTINASSPGGTPPFTFNWYKWNDVLNDFDPLPFKTETGITSLTGNLDEGGYKIVISGGFNIALTGWISVDKPYSKASLQNRTCDYVALKGDTATDVFYYKNPSGGTRYKLPNKIRFLWSSNPSSSIPFPDLEINPQTFDPPLVDVIYKLQVSDSFGCLSESSFFYNSIHNKADFSVSPEKGEAPLEVVFTDKSIRADKYIWQFGDGKDSVSYEADPGRHIYYKPGEYSVNLTIESSLGCVDSMSFSKIVVEPSDLDIPNVFTPDGDGLNDSFIVESKSLRTLSMEVFSRSGMKVYAFYGEGEKLREWQGWDGKVNESSSEASPGVYFYLIRAYGWDDVNYDGEEYRGFVYLYR